MVYTSVHTFLWGTVMYLRIPIPAMRESKIKIFLILLSHIVEKD